MHHALDTPENLNQKVLCILCICTSDKIAMASLVAGKVAQVSAAKLPASRKARACAVVCHAQAPSVDRRALLASVATIPLVASAPAWAAYGDSANVFGKVTNRSGFIPYKGEDFALALPSKWNPSREREFNNIVLRYEDNGDVINNLLVIRQPTNKNNISDFGSPEQFLDQVAYLLGRQSFEGETQSEGGFAPNRVSSASLLDVSEEQDKKGKTYYTLNILTRTADGDEGGKHQLIKATVSNGQLYILKVQAGDKRWFKGANKDCLGVLNSFTVA